MSTETTPEPDSILNSIKHLLDIPAEYDVFDQAVTIHINSIFGTLTQLGVGPKEGFSINGATEVWSDYLNDQNQINGVKSYIWAKVQLMFDPPSNAFLVSSLETIAKEFEFRLNVAAEELNRE